MYSLLFAFVLGIYLWLFSRREGLTTTGTTSTTGSQSACDVANAQNEADLNALDTKITNALALSETIKKMEATLQHNTTQIDTIINTQLTSLINGKR